MAYSTSNSPAKIAEAVNGAGSVWIYKDGDAIAAIDATDYFSNAGDLGMQTGDVLIVIGNNLTSIGQMTIDADGNGTVSALTAFP